MSAATLSSEEIEELIRTVLMLLRSPSREVVKSAIGFVKVCIVCLADEEIGPFLPELVRAPQPASVGFTQRARSP